MTRVLARAALLAAGAATSFYALLCFLPFSWANFIRNKAYPDWVGPFLTAHAPLAAGAVVLGAWSLSGRARAVFAAAGAAAVAASAWLGGPAALEHGPRALWAAFAALAPYFLWEALAGPDSAEEEPAAGASPLAPVAAGVFCALAGWLTRLAAAGAPPAGERAAEALALGRSALTHAALFAGAFLLAGAAEALPARARPWAARAGAWAAAAGVLKIWVLDALDFRGPAAWAYAAALGAALAAAVLRARPGRAARAAAASPARFAAALLALACLPAAAHLALRGSDWNRLLETLLTLGVWAAAAAFWTARPAPVPPSFSARLAPAAAVLALAWTAEGATRLFDGALRRRLILAPEAARALAERDASLGAIRRLLGGASRDDFHAYLRAHTNLPPGSVTPRAPQAPPAPLPAKPPHLFVVVVDSLRADRVRPETMPELSAFAREADSLRGFTPYGGTALSEPSLWAGAMLPHEQYPRPFPPLNALERLADGLGYRTLATWDTILERLLDPAKRETALDKDATGNYKLCRTLDELDGRLDAELATGRPLLVYTQPQDLHISVLAREGADYDARAREVDACLGRLFKTLKSKGLWEDAAVVVTSDHGDSLGEGGRWGHAYTIFPEILRVPLLVRLPKRLRANLAADLDSPAFLQDLVPSLRAALGLPPEGEGEPFGRSFYGGSPEALAATRRAERLVGSSYGPVWGVLGGGGDWLYLADAVEFKSHWYDMKADPAGARDLLDPEKDARGRAALRRLVASLQGHYRY